MDLSKLTSLTPLEAKLIQQNLPRMTKVEKLELFDDLDRKEKRASLIAAQTNILGFARAVYPGFKTGPHHRKLAKIFEDVISGNKKRVIINIAPRHVK